MKKLREGTLFRSSDLHSASLSQLISHTLQTLAQVLHEADSDDGTDEGDNAMSATMTTDYRCVCMCI